MLRPVGRTRQRHDRLIRTSLRRLDKLAVLVVVLDGPGLLGCLIDVSALEVEAVQRHRDALRLAVVDRRCVVDREVVAALAHDDAALEVLRRITGVGLRRDRHRVEARLHIFRLGVPLDGVPAIDGLLLGERLLIAGAVALALVRLDHDLDLRVRHTADRAGQEDVRGDGLALSDALKVLAVLVGVDHDGHRDAGVRRHQDVGIVDLPALDLLIDLGERALGDRLILDGDDRAIRGVLLNRPQNDGHARGVCDVLPMLGVCKVCTILIAERIRIVQLLPLDGVIRVRSQLCNGIQQIIRSGIAQLPVERVDVAQLQHHILLVGLEHTVVNADVDALLAASFLLPVLILAVINHRGIDGDFIIVRGAASCLRDLIRSSRLLCGLCAGHKGRVAEVDRSDLHIAMGVVARLDRQLIGLDRGDLVAIGVGLQRRLAEILINARRVLVVERDLAGGLHGGVGTLRRCDLGRQLDLIELIDIRVFIVVPIDRRLRDGVDGLNGHDHTLQLADHSQTGRSLVRHVVLADQLDVDIVAVLVVAGREARTGSRIGLLVVAGLDDPLDVVIASIDRTAIQRDNRILLIRRLRRAGLPQRERMLHTSQQIDQIVIIIGVVFSFAIQRSTIGALQFAVQCRLDGRRLQLCRLDISLRTISAGGIIGLVLQIDGLERFNVIGHRRRSCLRTYVIAWHRVREHSHAGGLAVGVHSRLANQLPRGLAARIRAGLTIELNSTHTDRGLIGIGLRDLGNQIDRLMLVLRLVCTIRSKALFEERSLAIDDDRVRLVVRVDLKRDFGLLKRSLLGRLGDQAFIILVGLDRAVFVIGCGLGVDARVRRIDSRAEHIAGVLRRDLDRIAVHNAGAVIHPCASLVLILPLHHVVLADVNALRIARLTLMVYIIKDDSAVQFDDLRNSQPIGALGDHNAVIDLFRKVLIGVNGQLILGIDPLPVCLSLLRNDPRNGLRVDAQIIRRFALGIALFVGGREYDLVFPAIAVLRLGCLFGVTPLVFLNLGVEHAVGAAVDIGRANERPFSVLRVISMPLVERHRALCVDIVCAELQMADERDVLALIGIFQLVANRGAAGLRISELIRNNELRLDLLGLPDGIQIGILFEVCHSTRLIDLIFLVVRSHLGQLFVGAFTGKRQRASRDLAPTEEGIPIPLRLEGADRVIRRALDIILDARLRAGDLRNIIARVGEIVDGDGLALDVGDGDARVARHVVEHVVDGGDAGRFIDRDRIAETHRQAVGGDRQLAVIIALVDHQIKRHAVAIRDVELTVYNVGLVLLRLCRIVAGIVHPVLEAKTARMVMRSSAIPYSQIANILFVHDRDRRHDGNIHGPEFRGLRDNPSENSVVGNFDFRVALVAFPMMELVTADFGNGRHGSIVTVFDVLDHEFRCLLLRVRTSRTFAQRHKVQDSLDFVRSDADLNGIILLYARNLIDPSCRMDNLRVATLIFKVLSSVLCTLQIDRVRSVFIRIGVADRGCLGRILTLDVDHELEGIAMCDRIDASGDGAIARAGRNRHGVGLLGPHCVERQRRVSGDLAAGLVGYRAVRARGPTFEIVASKFRPQIRDRVNLAVRLVRLVILARCRHCASRDSANRLVVRVLRHVRIIRNQIGLLGQLTIDDGIVINRGGRLLSRLHDSLAASFLIAEDPRILECRILIPAIEVIAVDLRVCRCFNGAAIRNILRRIVAHIGQQDIVHTPSVLFLDTHRNVDRLIRHLVLYMIFFRALKRTTLIANDMLLPIDNERHSLLRARNMQLDLERVAIAEFVGRLAVCRRSASAAIDKRRIVTSAARQGDDLLLDGRCSHLDLHLSVLRIIFRHSISLEGKVICIGCAVEGPAQRLAVQRNVTLVELITSFQLDREVDRRILRYRSGTALADVLNASRRRRPSDIDSILRPLCIERGIPSDRLRENHRIAILAGCPPRKGIALADRLALRRDHSVLLNVHRIRQIGHARVHAVPLHSVLRRRIFPLRINSGRASDILIKLEPSFIHSTAVFRLGIPVIKDLAGRSFRSAGIRHARVVLIDILRREDSTFRCIRITFPIPIERDRILRLIALHPSGGKRCVLSNGCARVIDLVINAARPARERITIRRGQRSQCNAVTRVDNLHRRVNVLTVKRHDQLVELHIVNNCVKFDIFLTITRNKARTNRNHNFVILRQCSCDFISILHCMRLNHSTSRIVFSTTFCVGILTLKSAPIAFGRCNHFTTNL